MSSEYLNRRSRKEMARRNVGGAGKGSKRRPTNEDLFEAGYNISHAETEEEREYWTKEWYRIRKELNR